MRAMQRGIKSFSAALLLVPSLCAWAQQPAAVPTYALVRHIAGGGADGLFDYASIDAQTHRLYLAQGGVTVLDLVTDKITPHLVDAKTTHGVISTSRGLAAVAISSTNSVELFNAESGQMIANIPTGPSTRAAWHDPDALLLEPKSGLLVAVNGDSATLALIDMQKRSIIGTIRLKGKLEFAVADGAGIVYVNEEDEKKIAFVDIGLRKVVKEVALSNCDEPTGIAYDGRDNLVISVCANGVAKFVSAGTGAEIASLKVGGGCDAVLFDETRRVAFFPSGNDGTLTVVAIQGPRKIKVSQTISTMAGSRLGAVDPGTGNVYLPAAKFGPPAPPLKLPGLPEFPGMNPGTFEFLVIAPTAATARK